MTQVTLSGTVKVFSSHNPLTNDNISDEEIRKGLDLNYDWYVTVGKSRIRFQRRELSVEDPVEKTEENFYLRGDKVYYLPDLEFIKSFALIFLFPIFTFVEKIFMPICVYCPFKALSVWCGCFSERVKFLEEEHHMHERRPLRAIIGIVAHPIISALGLIPFFSNYFNKYNGDLERWVNGHTDKDLETKSCVRRCKEAVYIAPCQQPLFKFPTLPTSFHVNNFSSPTKELAFRVLVGAPLGSRKPQITRES